MTVLESLNEVLETHGTLAEAIAWRDWSVREIVEGTVEPEMLEDIRDAATDISCLLDDLWEITGLSIEGMNALLPSQLRSLVFVNTAAPEEIAALVTRREMAYNPGQRPVRDAFRAAYRGVRMRLSGYAASRWLPGYGENTPMSDFAKRCFA